LNFNYKKRYDELVRAFDGSRITQVGFGVGAVQLLLDGGCIYIEGHWELTDTTTRTLDCSSEFDHREDFSLWRIVGRRVANFAATQEEVFTISFTLDNGMLFRAWEDEPGLESIVISLDRDRERIVL
jgi:hypothetical protein